MKLEDLLTEDGAGTAGGAASAAATGGDTATTSACVAHIPSLLGGMSSPISRKKVKGLLGYSASGKCKYCDLIKGHGWVYGDINCPSCGKVHRKYKKS